MPRLTVCLTIVASVNAHPNSRCRWTDRYLRSHRPETNSPLLGLFGRIKPEIDADKTSGRIHIGVQLASGPEEVLSATFGTGQTVDRVELEVAQLESSIATAPNKWTLAGSVALTSPTSSSTSGEAFPHLAVLVRWSVVD